MASKLIGVIDEVVRREVVGRMLRLSVKLRLEVRPGEDITATVPVLVSPTNAAGFFVGRQIMLAVVPMDGIEEIVSPEEMELAKPIPSGRPAAEVLAPPNPLEPLEPIPASTWDWAKRAAEAKVGPGTAG